MEFQTQQTESDAAPTAIANVLFYYWNLLADSESILAKEMQTYQSCYDFVHDLCGTDVDGTWDLQLNEALAYSQQYFRLFRVKQQDAMIFSDLKEHLQKEGTTIILSHIDYQGEDHVTLITGFSEKFGGYQCVNFYGGIPPVTTRVSEDKMRELVRLNEQIADARGNGTKPIAWLLTAYDSNILTQTFSYRNNYN